jgi:predicted enzyme related to lactoylglutathione lyase
MSAMDSQPPVFAYATISSPQAGRLVAFYRGLLDREVTFDTAPYTVIAPTQRPVCIAFQQVESTSAATPVHVDMHAVDLDAASARVEQLGGRLGDRHSGVGSVWRQAFDPDGNVFCLLSRPELDSPARDPD